jgi:hypothetical protein
MEGITDVKGLGIYQGRTASIDAAEVRKPAAEAVGATEIAWRPNISRPSVDRLLATEVLVEWREPAAFPMEAGQGRGLVTIWRISLAATLSTSGTSRA